MIQNSKWYNKKYIEEIIFFIALFLLVMLPELIKTITQTEFVKTLLFFLILYIQALLHRYFIFTLFLSKQYVIYTVTAIVFTLLGAATLLISDYYWIDPIYYQEQPDTMFDHYISHLVLCIISTSAILSIFLIRKYSNEVQKRNEAQLMLSEINIKYLYAQLNPHFFFNMFNNLYGISLTEPERTPELILKFSNLMRYQLENAKKEVVTLQEELIFIGNYIDIEKERVGNRCKIQYSIKDDKQLAYTYHIAPLLLITIVENAFKHSLTINREWFIIINVKVEQNLLNIEIDNSLADQAMKVNSTGIGLSNIKQRLGLLYPNNFELKTNKHNNTFTTRLVLNLK